MQTSKPEIITISWFQFYFNIETRDLVITVMKPQQGSVKFQESKLHMAVIQPVESRNC